MKLFSGTLIYRNCQFDYRACFKTIKQASLMLNLSEYVIRKYVYISKIEIPFEGILVKAYSYKAKQAIGHQKEMPFEQAKELIDIYLTKNK